MKKKQQQQQKITTTTHIIKIRNTIIYGIYIWYTYKTQEVEESSQQVPPNKSRQRIEVHKAEINYTHHDGGTWLPTH